MRALLTVLTTLVLAAPLWAAGSAIPNPGFEDVDGAGWATGWGRYQWGPETAEGEQRVDATVAHSGSHSLVGANLDASARGGAYTHVALGAGSWALSFWAKAAPGRTALVRCYLATAYSRSFLVEDEWTQITYRNTLMAPVERAEINVQNASGEPGEVWFDDISLEPAEVGAYVIEPDTRPEAQRPRVLYFDAHLMSWADKAAEWKARGFSGAFISGIFHDVHSDPWAADGDPQTRGEDDKLLQECRAANAKCLQAGVDSNALKVAMYEDFPEPFDDAGWARLTANFREAARFARLAGFPCVAVDTEYTAYQFEPTWSGYAAGGHSAAELSAKMQERWAVITAAMVAEYPAMELLLLPEGAICYGPLWSAMLAGMIDGLIARQHAGGIHVFCEGTYQMRDPVNLSEYVVDVRETTARKLPEPARSYWRERGSVAVGCWPLGYYRAISDKDGKFLGWSGKAEVFGDAIVGSYADKSENYPLAEFAVQMAAARGFSGRYCWVYSHSWSWSQMSPEEDQYYKAHSVQPYSSQGLMLPTVPNIAEYYKVTATSDVARVVEEPR